MERISIPIKKVSSGFSTKTLMATTLSTLMLGVLMGTFTGNTLTLPLPQNLRSVLGATGAATLEQETPKTTPTAAQPTANTTSSSLPTTPEAPESVPVAASTPEASTEQKATLVSIVEEKNLAIEQNIAEIKRIKNESVALITQFNQNCGDWTDVCAVTYRDTLEKNNTAYEELLVTQRALYRELGDAQRALRDVE